MIGGLRLTDVVKHLLIINVLMFFGTLIILGDSNLLGEGRNILGLAYPESPFFSPYQLVTHMFMHADPGHLFFNMLALVIFGPSLEALWGPKKFLSYYFMTGFGAMFLHMSVQFLELHYMGNEGILRSLSWGASGALYGLLIAFGLNFPNRRLMLIIPPIPVRAIYLVLILISMDIFLGFNDFAPGIAHFAHLGGALFGFLIMEYWKKNP